MTSPHANGGPPQISIWYFVGATFIFAAPALFFPDAELWVRIILLAAGCLAIVAGGVQLGREIAHRRTGSDTPPTTDSDTEREE